jgi:hypothetical protein
LVEEIKRLEGVFTPMNTRWPEGDFGKQAGEIPLLGYGWYSLILCFCMTFRFRRVCGDAGGEEEVYPFIRDPWVRVYYAWGVKMTVDCVEKASGPPAGK